MMYRNQTKFDIKIIWLKEAANISKKDFQTQIAKKLRNSSIFVFIFTYFLYHITWKVLE